MNTLVQTLLQSNNTKRKIDLRTLSVSMFALILNFIFFCFFDLHKAGDIMNAQKE